VIEYWYLSESDIDGYTGSMGMLYKFEPIGRLGLNVQFPRKLTLDGVYEDEEYIDRFESDITLPFTLGGGIAITPPNFLLAFDLRYTDWSQIDFEGPVRFVDQYGRPRSAYESTTEVHVGAEIMFPDMPIRLRAGYYYDPLPYRLFFTDNAYYLADIEQERDYFTLGGGVILQEALTLDVAYVSGGFVRSAQTTVEDQDQDRLFMSAAYRF
jgi:long-subunit fatty acid transport protein